MTGIKLFFPFDPKPAIPLKNLPRFSLGITKMYDYQHLYGKNHHFLYTRQVGVDVN